MSKISLEAVPNVPLINQGDSVSKIILDACNDAGIDIGENDVIVIASKIISKAEGRIVELGSVTPSPRAIAIAKKSNKDERIVELMLQESKGVIDVKPGVIVTVHRLGFVCTSAGIDRANVPKDTVSLLPRDPDKSAKKIRAEIMQSTGNTIAVLINDSLGIEYRTGSIGLTIGVAGMPALLLGDKKEVDLYKTPRNVRIMLADELSAAASLLMGQSSAGSPIVIVKGLNYEATEKSCLTDLIENGIYDTYARKGKR